MDNRFETFMTLTARIQKCTRRLKAETMSQMNLKSSHAYCIYYLYKNKNVTLKKLSELSGEDKGAISRTVEFLRAEGYVIVAEGKGHYKHALILTEKGAEAGRLISDKIDRVLCKVSEEVDDEERLAMYDTLDKICSVMESFV